MRRSDGRRFTILDGMILVAFAAAGSFLARIGPNEWMQMPIWLGRIYIFHRQSPTLFLATVSLSVIPLRLRRPRPTRARIMRQPGMAAAVAVAVALLVAAASWSIYAVRIGQGWLDRDFVARYWRGHSTFVAPTVAGAWLALWLGGRWRPERGWIDRLGRLFGAAWLVLLPLQPPFVHATMGLIVTLTRWSE